MRNKKKKINVGFLLDKNNNWLIDHIDFDFFKKNFNIDSILIYNVNEIPKLEILFVLGYTKLIPKKFYCNCKLPVVIHESNLPMGRGFSPIQWQILAGINKIKVCLIELSERFDSGDIIYTTNIQFKETDLYDDIRKKQSQATFRLVYRLLKNYPKYKKKPQEGKISYFKKRTKKDSRIDINKSIKEQFNLLRINNNESWPSYFFINNTKFFLKIYKDEK